ncbi:MAG: SDR family oxidoreductase [Longimicrobiales bacterium]|nr:SDR family oxidoreductase [Longimicrobiales bacterium]
MAEKILVTGATGKVGSELVRRLADRRVEVKAGTRRPELAEGLFGGAVEVVELDYDVTSTWDGAVQWADRVFLVPPPFDPRGDERLVPFLDWAVQSGSQHVVLLSAMGIEAREQLALRRIEQRIQRTGVRWTLLRPNIYMQNFARGFVARAIREEGAFHLPVGDAHVSFVDGRDVASVAAEVLTADRHFGEAYTLTGPDALDHHQVAAIIGEATGRSIGYEPIPEAEMQTVLADAGWPQGRADTFAGLMAAIREGRRSEVTPDIRRLLDRPPTSFRAFAEEHADDWR